MTSISTLRQIVKDIHAVAPQGARKAVRAKLTEQISRPISETEIMIEQLRFKSDMQNAVMEKVFTRNGDDFTVTRHSYATATEVSSFETRYKLRKHLSNIFDKEKNTLIKNTLTKLGVEIKNKTINEIEPNKTFEILQGLNISKKVGFKLPKTVVVEDLRTMNCSGYFILLQPKKIHIDPNKDKLCATTIHETAHKNDIAGHIVNTIPAINAFSLIADTFIQLFNKNLITKEVRNYAATNRDEFIACTVEKLLSEQKTWTDLDPKIKKLYNLFLGPKFKTNEL
jgi:hypothetical protein